MASAQFVFFVAALFLLVCALLAQRIAKQKHAASDGFFYGLVLGPIGIVAAGFLDQRPLCPRCGGRTNGLLESPFEVCEHCNVEFNVLNGFPKLTSDLQQIRDLRRHPVAPLSDEVLRAKLERLGSGRKAEQMG